MQNSVEELTGEAGQKKIKLSTRSGASCEVYVYGAHVTSWKTADGVERLYLSSTSEYETGKAIRGGIPICWPQFSSRGKLPKHGFCRTADSWKVRRSVSEPKPSVTLELQDCPASAEYPFSFKLTYTVTLESDSTLITRMQVVNQSDDALTFTGALHTYFAVSDVTRVSVSGLQGLDFQDNARGGELGKQAEEQLLIGGEVDRVYVDAPDEVIIFDGTTSISIEKHGFPDAVVWNIGESKAPSMKDLGPDEWQRYICVEAGSVAKEMVLQPSGEWTGEQKLSVSTAVAAKVIEFGAEEPLDGPESLEKVEQAFKAKMAPGKESLPLQDAWEAIVSTEEGLSYSFDDFLGDIKIFAPQMSNQEELTWAEAKQFLEIYG